MTDKFQRLEQTITVAINDALIKKRRSVEFHVWQEEPVEKKNLDTDLITIVNQYRWSKDALPGYFLEFVHHVIKDEIDVYALIEDYDGKVHLTPIHKVKMLDL